MREATAGPRMHAGLGMPASRIRVANSRLDQGTPVGTPV